MPESTPYPTCAHIREDGSLCGSPALRGNRLCYYHQRDLYRLRNLRQARSSWQRVPTPLRPLPAEETGYEAKAA